MCNVGYLNNLQCFIGLKKGALHSKKKNQTGTTNKIQIKMTHGN